MLLLCGTRSMGLAFHLGNPTDSSTHRSLGMAFRVCRQLVMQQVNAALDKSQALLQQAMNPDLDVQVRAS